MKSLFKRLICYSCLMTINNALAAKYVDYYDSFDNHNAGQNILSNQILFKIKATGIQAKSKGSGLPNVNPTTGTAVNNVNYDLIPAGFGGEVSSSVFFTEYFASEIALGFHAYKTKQKVIDDVSRYYSSTPDNTHKSLNIYSIPLQIIFQYHVAPFGGITPYVGLGWGGAYFFSQNKSFKVKNLELGPIVQLGCDIWAQDNTAVTFEVKKQFLRQKISYKAAFIGTDNDLPSKLKINPIFISLGLTYKF